MANDNDSGGKAPAGASSSSPGGPTDNDRPLTTIPLGSVIRTLENEGRKDLNDPPRIERQQPLSGQSEKDS